MRTKHSTTGRLLGIFILLCSCSAACTDNNDSTASLKDAFRDKFYIGVAMNVSQIRDSNKTGVGIIKRHFNSIVAENCMKSAILQPQEGVFNFADADRFVAFGKQNKMWIIGHTLIWHSQTPDWFFKDKEGNEVTKEVLIERMKNHITTVVSRYKGRVNGWDVVNEAILDDGSFRNSKFYQIVGEDFIRLAFEFARDADPGAELYYNDFSMSKEGKRNGVVGMVKKLKEQGAKIDGIGMQGHLSLTYPSIDEFERSIVAFSELGVKVMITEMDITVLPTPLNESGADISHNYEYQKQWNPYPDKLPEEQAKALQERYADFFRLFLKHAGKISRVTLWGVGDRDSWRNNWPIRGRTDYALLFDREYKAKPVVEEIIRMAVSEKQYTEHRK